MSRSTLAAGVRHLRGILAAQYRRDDSDEQLLQAFAACHDDSAFAALVHRHGPMVLHVCRRVLGHEQDAEDAFQATFLVLARNAAKLRKKTALASYLHGTAYRIALNAKRSAARRRKYENSLGALTQPRSPVDPSDDLLWRDVRALLDEEIARLPEKYRSVLVLCCLEHLSQAEAGRRLGMKERTVSNRLAEAQKRLARRLAKRGVELTAVLAAAALATPPTSALPPLLLASTIEAALAAVTGEGLAGLVSVAVVDLTEGAMAAVMLSKTKIAAVLLLTASILAGAGVWAYRGSAANAVLPSTLPAEPHAAKVENKPQIPPAKNELTKNVEIRGRVLGVDGKPKAGAKLLLLDRDGHVKQLGVSAAGGRFTVAVAKETMKDWGHWLIAQAEKTGFDFLDLYQLKHEKPVELRLVKDNPIRGRIVNTEGKPIRGVRVTAEEIGVYGHNSLETFRAAWMRLWAGGSGDGSVKNLYAPLGALTTAVTDADGRFVINGIGAERTVRFRLRATGIADTSVRVANRAGLDPKPFNQPVLDRIRKGQLGYRSWLLSGPEVSVVADAEKVIRGVVTDTDTGKAQSGIVVRLTQDSDERLRFSPEAKTDAEGRYEIHGVRKTKKYLLAIAANSDTGYMHSQIWAEDTIAHQPVRADIKIKRGVIVTGHVIDGPSGKAIPGFVMAAVLYENPFVKDYPNFRHLGVMPYESYDRTDADRPFRVVTIPGPMLLMGKTEGMSPIAYKGTGADPKYPQYFDDNGGYRGYNGGLLQGQWNKVLQIKPGVAVVKQDIVLERVPVVAEVRVQDTKGRPLAEAWATVGDRKSSRREESHVWIQYGRLDEHGCCLVHGETNGKPQLLVFYAPDKKLAGTWTLKRDEKQPVIVQLGPTGAVKGRLLDADGKPLAEVVVDVRYRDHHVDYIHEDSHEGKEVVTDANGAFALDDVIPEWKFEFTFRRGKHRFERAAKSADSAIQVKPGECRDVGAIKLRVAPNKD